MLRSGAGVFEGPGLTVDEFSIPAIQIDPNRLGWNRSWQIPIFQSPIKIENNNPPASCPLDVVVICRPNPLLVWCKEGVSCSAICNELSYKSFHP